MRRNALADLRGKLMFREAIAAEVADHGPRFRSVRLEGTDLAGRGWNPGDRIHVRVDDGFTTRTYTPIGWDAVSGSTRLLVYAHTSGPGSRWSRRLQPGTPCQVSGPFRSLKLSELAGPVVLAGDETSLALASALGKANGRNPLHAAIFEMTSPDECAKALGLAHVGPAQVIGRHPSEAHLDALTGAVIEALRSSREAFLCLTGKAQTINYVRRGVRATGLAGRPILVKAYWAA